MYFRKTNRKGLSVFLALVLSLFGAQTIFVNTAEAACVGYCITYPTDFTISGTSVTGLYVGTFFSTQVTDTGGTDPITVADMTPSIPGLTMSASGFLSGTPTLANTYVVNIGTTDSAHLSTLISNVHIVVSATPPVVAVVPDPPQKSSISAISPSSGPTAGGTSVTVSGSFPATITNIQVNGVFIKYSSWTQTSTGITFTMPAHAAGDVVVQLFNGDAPLLAGVGYTYTDEAPAPMPIPTPTPTPTLTPTPSPTPTPTPSPSATPTPTPTPSPTPSPIPKPILKKAGTINFANNSSALDETAKSEIKAIADQINNSSASKIYLYGYTDLRGDAAYNLSLSKKRAESVSNYLLPLLTNLTLKIGWKGANNPADPGNSEAAYAKNRRVEIWTK
jgi:outer membrane protein OmpA-like peptidoglycan-associated protein